MRIKTLLLMVILAASLPALAWPHGAQKSDDKTAVTDALPSAKAQPVSDVADRVELLLSYSSIQDSALFIEKVQHEADLKKSDAMVLGNQAMVAYGKKLEAAQKKYHAEGCAWDIHANTWDCKDADAAALKKKEDAAKATQEKHDEPPNSPKK